MKAFTLLILILLTGCTTLPKYNYQSQANIDPEIIFGDRFGGGKVTSPARSFKVNTNDVLGNRCSEFSIVGTTSNHWMGVVPKSVQIKVPAGRAVSIAGAYMLSTGYSNTSCTPPTLMFLPKDSATYSVDIETNEKSCVLRVVQKMANGQLDNVDGIENLPNCKDK